MIAIDMIGLMITVFIVGLRYTPYVLFATLINGIGQVVMAVFLHGHIDTVVAAGAFGRTMVSHLTGNMATALITFSGPLANYIVGATIGGVEFERTSVLFNPFAHLKHPLAVINLRLSFFTFIVGAWHLFWK